jgi:acetyltransferase-like isoleucine patch superfamily enzyme
MKNLFEYINDSNVNLFLETLDADIHYQSINESIQSSILMDFIKQITSMRNEQKERGDWRISTPLFKDMFRWRHIAWDKVKDSDFEICKHLQGDESDKKLVKARKDMEKKVRQVIKVESNAIVILRSPKTEKFTYYIDETGSMYQVSDGRRLSASRSGRDISQSERMYYVQENDIYYLPVKELSTDSKRADRYKSREGMIDFDKDSLRKIALEKNRDSRGKIGLVKRYAIIKALAINCGDNVAVYTGAYIMNPQTMEFGNNVSIHPMCYLESGSKGEVGIKIGNDVSIAHGATIMATSHNFNDVDIPIKDQGVTVSSVVIEDNVWIGAKATILSGVTVKSGCIIGANSVVTHDTEENGVYVGAPARKIKSRVTGV